MERLARLAPTGAAVALGLACLAIASLTVSTLREPVSAHAEDASPPASVHSPGVEHAPAIEAAHLFGVPQAVVAEAGEAQDSSYVVSGIVCMENAGHCSSAFPAVATLDGPGGQTVVQAGTRLPTGEGVVDIEPRAVVLSRAGGVFKLPLKITMADTDQFTAILPLDGTVPVNITSRAKPTAALEQLQANLKALDSAMRASQARLRATSSPGQRTVENPVSPGGTP